MFPTKLWVMSYAGLVSVLPRSAARQMNWGHFIRTHMAILAGIDFFTVEVLTWRVGTLLRSLLLAPGDAPRHGRRNHSASHRAMDGADGPYCCGRGRRHAASGPLRLTRSRHQTDQAARFRSSGDLVTDEVLQFLSNDASV